MPDQAADKSQEPTPHRRQKARAQGHVAKSQDLGSAALLLLGLPVLMILGGGLIDFLGRFSKRQLGGSAWLSADVHFAVSEWNWTLSALARFLLPIFGLLLLGAIAVNVLQIGFLFLPQRLAPDLARLDPIRGLKRIFSLANLVRMAFGIVKILVVAAVALLSLYAERHAILSLTDMAVPVIALYMVEILLWTSIKIGLALLVLALLDYAFQRWKFEQDIKMTPQEVREEMKNLGGSRQLTSRLRRVQRQLAFSRLCDAVPKADLLITNPAELAVAVRYRPQSMDAPMVTAKGAGLTAQRMHKLAREHGVPVVEKKPLARALYHEVDVQGPIPEDKYAAVAELLADVYQRQGGQQ